MIATLTLVNDIKNYFKWRGRGGGLFYTGIADNLPSFLTIVHITHGKWNQITKKLDTDKSKMSQLTNYVLN